MTLGLDVRNFVSPTCPVTQLGGATSKRYRGGAASLLSRGAAKEPSRGRQGRGCFNRNQKWRVSDPLARFARVSPSRGGDLRLQRESLILPLRVRGRRERSERGGCSHTISNWSWATRPEGRGFRLGSFAAPRLQSDARHAKLSWTVPVHDRAYVQFRFQLPTM